LKKMRGQLLSGDQILIGLDLVKDKHRLLSAYDDPTGITAAFNLNVLARLNLELDAGFQLRNFEHLALWNDSESRVEMHLESVRQQTVRIPTHGAVRSLTVHFAPGETIHTENSHKCTFATGASLLRMAGFSPTKVWNDEEELFSVTLAEAA
jgi:L-histidine Nalpha-methyltransferase